MILLDADVILVDQRYVTDKRHTINRAALDRLQAEGIPLAMMAHTILEVVGILSFGTPAADVPQIPEAIRTTYGITTLPDPVAEPDYARCTFSDLTHQMSLKMSLADAVQAVQIRLFAPHADALLTWNAKHFRGKVTVPVLTPEEWLNLQPPPATPTP